MIMVSSNGSTGEKSRGDKSEPATPAKSRAGRMREAVAEALAERTYKDSEVQRIAQDVEGLQNYVRPSTEVLLE